MVSCPGFQGNANMYGLGIRTALYLQWFGIIAASWLSQEETLTLCILNSLFEAAMFMALLIQTTYATAGIGSLRPVEIYITMLLVFGFFYFLVPLYLWKVVTCFRPALNPVTARSTPGRRLFNSLNFLLLAILLGYQMWFWGSGLHILQNQDCPEHGFFFSKIALDNPGFVGWNILFNLAMLLGCGLVVCGMIGVFGRKRRRRKRISPVQITALQELHTMFNLIVATTITAAAELTIQWNEIRGVNDVSTAAQLIPLLVTVGLLARVVYAWLLTRAEGDDSDDEEPSSSGGNSGSGFRSGPPPGRGSTVVSEISYEEPSGESEIEEYVSSGGGGGGGEGGYDPGVGMHPHHPFPQMDGPPQPRPMPPAFMSGGPPPRVPF